METIQVDEKRLEELIEKAVRKHLNWLFIDMEELRQSPAGIIIRLETELESIEKRHDHNTITRHELMQTIGQIKTSLSNLEDTGETHAGNQKAIDQIKARLGKLQAIVDEQSLP